MTVRLIEGGNAPFVKMAHFLFYEMLADC